MNFLHGAAQFKEEASLFIHEPLTYPYLLNRHRLLGPLNRAGVLVQLIYITVSVFCLGFLLPTISVAGIQAGRHANQHDSSLRWVLSRLPRDLFRFPLDTNRCVHRSAGSMDSYSSINYCRGQSYRLLFSCTRASIWIDSKALWLFLRPG